MSDNLFLGDKNMIFFISENNFFVPEKKVSDISKTYINKGLGQKFELLDCFLDPGVV
jgi:hypothetical protein